QICLRRGGGVDLGGNMSDHPIGPLLGAGRIEPAAERPTMPMAGPVPIAVAEGWSEALTERGGGESADAREAEAKRKGNRDFCKPARPRRCGRGHGGGGCFFTAEESLLWSGGGATPPRQSRRRSCRGLLACVKFCKDANDHPRRCPQPVRGIHDHLFLRIVRLLAS